MQNKPLTGASAFIKLIKTPFFAIIYTFIFLVLYLIGHYLNFWIPLYVFIFYIVMTAVTSLVAVLDFASQHGWQKMETEVLLRIEELEKEVNERIDSD